MSGRYIVDNPYIHFHAQVVTHFNPIRILEKGTIIIVNAGSLYQIKVRLYASVFTLRSLICLDFQNQLHGSKLLFGGSRPPSHAAT